jgi:hypothetical protein
MTAAPPPNWYPDPHDKAQLRWWDGSQWTEHRHPAVPTQPSTAQLSTAQPSTESQVNTTHAPVAAAAPGDADEMQPASAPLPTQEKPTVETPTSMLPALITYPESSPTPKSRTPMIIGAAVIAVLVVGVIAFAATRGGDDDKIGQSSGTAIATTTNGATTRVATTSPTATTTRAPATTVATTVNTPAGTTFTDATNVYRVRVAPTWQDATASGGLQTWTTGTSSSQFKDQVNVLIEKLPSDISMEDYLAASVKNAPKSLPSFVEVGRSFNTVNGKVLGQLDFRSTQNGVALRHRAVVVIRGRNAIVVTYTAEPGRFDTESANVQPYLTSIEGV